MFFREQISILHQHYDASSNKKEVLKAIDAFAHDQQEKNVLLVMLHKQNSLPMVISQISVFGVIAIPFFLFLYVSVTAVKAIWGPKRFSVMTMICKIKSEEKFSFKISNIDQMIALTNNYTK